MNLSGCSARCSCLYRCSRASGSTSNAELGLHSGRQEGQAWSGAEGRRGRGGEWGEVAGREAAGKSLNKRGVGSVGLWAVVGNRAGGWAGEIVPLVQAPGVWGWRRWEDTHSPITSKNLDSASLSGGWIELQSGQKNMSVDRSPLPHCQQLR